MEKTKPLLEEENRILITANFLAAASGIEGKSAETYELDLIVNDTITLDELLCGLYQGMEQQMNAYPPIEAPDGPGSPAADAGRPTDETGKDDMSLREYARYKRKRRNDRQKVCLQLTPDQQKRRELQRCLEVFRQCIAGYDPPVQNQNLFSLVRGRTHPRILRDMVWIRDKAPGRFRGPMMRTGLCLKHSRHGSCRLRDLGFLTASKLVFDASARGTACEMVQKKEAVLARSGSFPQDRPGKQILTAWNRNPVQIPQADPMPSGQNPELHTMLFLMPLVIAACVVCSGLLFRQTMEIPQICILGMALILSTVIAAVLSHAVSVRMQKGDQLRWKKQYEAFFSRILKEMIERQRADLEHFETMYPPVMPPAAGKKCGADRPVQDNCLLTHTCRFSETIHSRRPEQEDFLCVRVGSTTARSKLVPSVFPIKGEPSDGTWIPVRYRNIGNQRRKTFCLQMGTGQTDAGRSDGTQGDLQQLPADIAAYYSHLRGAPVLLNLRRNAAVGLLLQDPGCSFRPVITNLVFDLCYHQSADQLRMVMLCEPTSDPVKQQKQKHLYQMLPHFTEVGPRTPVFVYSQAQAQRLFHQLEQLVRQRMQQTRTELPHIVVVAREEYRLRQHPLFSLLQKDAADAHNQAGVTVLYCKRSPAELPSCCTAVVQATDAGHWYLHRNPAENEILSDTEDIRFQPDRMPDPELLRTEPGLWSTYRRAVAILSAMRPVIPEDCRVPARAELFDVLDQSFHLDEMRKLSVIPLQADEAWVRNVFQRTKRFVHDCRLQSQNDLGGHPDRVLPVPIGLNEEGPVWLDLNTEHDGQNLIVAGAAQSGKTDFLRSYLISLCALCAPAAGHVIAVASQKSKLYRLANDLPDNICQAIDGDRMPDLSRPGYRGIDFVLEWLEQEKESRKKQAEPQRARRMRHLFLILDDLEQLCDLPNADEAAGTRLQRMANLFGDSRKYGLHLMLSCTHPERLPEQLLHCFGSRLCLRTESPEQSRCMLGTAAELPVRLQQGHAVLRQKERHLLCHVQLSMPDANLIPAEVVPFEIMRIMPEGETVSLFDSEAHVRTEQVSFASARRTPTQTGKPEVWDPEQRKRDSRDRVSRDYQRAGVDQRDRVAGDYQRTDPDQRDRVAGDYQRAGVDQRDHVAGDYHRSGSTNPETGKTEGTDFFREEPDGTTAGNRQEFHPSDPDVWGRKVSVNQMQMLTEVLRKFDG